MSTRSYKRLHASCVAVNGQGVLLIGPSGSGKSDLALRLIDQGAQLVSDDQVELSARDGTLIANAPEAIFGLLEIRGIGIVKTTALAACRVALVVDLARKEGLPRMPDPADRVTNLLGISMPFCRLDAFEKSCVAKIRFLMHSSTPGVPPLVQ